MFEYRPKLSELQIYPFIIWMVSLAIVGKIPAGEWRELAKFGYYAICINIALVPSVYLFRDVLERLNAMAGDSPRQDVEVDLQPTRASDVMPRTMAGGMELQYNQRTNVVKVDSVRLFNRYLIMQKHSGFEIDMTEDRWNKKKDGQEFTEWQKIGGIGKAEWKDMILRGIRWGAYAEVGGNNKRVPHDWNKIRRLERGEPLPE